MSNAEYPSEQFFREYNARWGLRENGFTPGGPTPILDRQYNVYTYLTAFGGKPCNVSDKEYKEYIEQIHKGMQKVTDFFLSKSLSALPIMTTCPACHQLTFQFHGKGIPENWGDKMPVIRVCANKDCGQYGETKKVDK